MSVVYPVLTVESLQERCKRDIAQFVKEQNIEPPPPPQELLITIENKKIFLEKITELKPKFQVEGDPPYVDAIKHVDIISVKQTLWIARTYLVYQLLIGLTLCLQNRELYEAIFLESELGHESIFKLPFRDDVIKFLLYIQLGIFGSLSPTSDIDIGFQYSGADPSYTGCLAYIVSRFELLFLIFTSKSCLDYDVESYADMLTVPNPGDDKIDHPDLFYLDISKVIWDETTQRQLLPTAFKSIVRNAMLEFKDQNRLELRDSDVESFKLQTVIDLFVQQPPSMDIKLVLPNVIKDLVKYDDLFTESKTTIYEFLKKSYTEQIQSYYDEVERTESLKLQHVPANASIETLKTLTQEQIISLIIAIGNALSFRIESYTCAPTVIHVVRILQAPGQPQSGEVASTKYLTTAPKEICDIKIKELTKPICVIGKTGFILSSLEQMGYVYRFHKRYCEEGAPHKNEGDCKKKIGKYGSRLINAINKLAVGHSGGKRVNRRIYTKHTFVKSSSRYNQKTKNKRRRFTTVKNHTKLYNKYRNSKTMKRTYLKKQ